MITTKIGQAAEELVSEYLRGKGWKIIERNWRRPRCEIDIVARDKSKIYFVEVKFRSSESQGGGLDYITPKKLKQMEFSARVWVAENNWNGDFELLAASVEFRDNTMRLKQLVEIS